MLNIRTYWDAINWAEEKHRERTNEEELRYTIEAIAFIYNEDPEDVKRDIQHRRGKWHESISNRIK